MARTPFWKSVCKCDVGAGFLAGPCRSNHAIEVSCVAQRNQLLNQQTATWTLEPTRCRWTGCFRVGKTQYLAKLPPVRSGTDRCSCQNGG